ncbi:hypothetical protein TIFTF001_003993 [Ficus carica]|uniref:Uncharacterized protein n=1 Tax=Ficus carica TaxID=3494 RepID=A0AA87ZG20_FICCA|nr:hypothetical protein TIFTF001_003993 [Ficus carica]
MNAVSSPSTTRLRTSHSTLSLKLVSGLTNLLQARLLTFVKDVLRAMIHLQSSSTYSRSDEYENQCLRAKC